MSSMTLRYIINLAGDLKRRAAENARAVEQAGKRQTTALTNTDKAAQKAEKSVEKVGAKTGASKLESDARRMQSGLNNVTSATQRADSALARLGSSTALDRQFRYLGSIARRMSDIRRDADRMAAVLGRAGQTAGAVTGGVVAGGAAAVATLKRPVQFDTRLANMANVAYGDRNLAGRLLGMKELEGTINDAVRQGGGTRDSAAEALNKVISSGVVKIDTAKAMLLDLQRGATAGDADVGDIGNIAIAGLRNYGLTEKNIGQAISKAVVAGQEGGFELKDMARWLPELMAASSDKLGMRGMADFERLVSYAQASIMTAGSADAAGNNLKNLLLKINSADTEKDFARLGVDLPKSLARARERGVDGIAAFVDFAEQIAGKNKSFISLRDRAASEQGDEKKATLQAMASILQGSAIGQVIQDREALMALVGIMQNKGYVKDVLAKVHEDTGQAVASNFDVISGRAGYKAQQVANETDMARSRVFDQIDSPLKAVLTSATDLAQAFPGVTTALTGFGQAVGIATAAGAGGAFTAFLLSRGRSGAPGGAGPGGLGGFGAGPIPVWVVNKMPGWDAPMPGGPGGAGGAGGAGGKRGAAFLGGARGAGMAAAAYAAYEAIPTLLDGSKSATEKVNDLGRIAAGATGAWAGMQAGAAIGAFGGPLAPITVPIGGAIGGALGYFGATRAGDALARMTATPSQRAGLLADAAGLPTDTQDRMSVLRTAPAYMANPLMQPSVGLDMIKRIQAEPQRVEIGNGQLGINVTVRDDRVMIGTQVFRQPNALRIDPGATNPGGTN
ncbi:phage tail tape measure protein [Pandoraea commovens]|uniref:Phage tail length tape measure protein n=1 Tax=Pandoraea commovens TaxID=2508289 RepID=A0A5E4RXM9_9BURK|nr:phage tail tape measure protein [Pandoraea commovens]VVD68246.1 phage tail length tape measure protein [Pandoraea commovens]